MNQTPYNLDVAPSALAQLQTRLNKAVEMVDYWQSKNNPTAAAAWKEHAEKLAARIISAAAVIRRFADLSPNGRAGRFSAQKAENLVLFANSALTGL